MERILDTRNKLEEELATFRGFVARQQLELEPLARIQSDDIRAEAITAHLDSEVKKPLERLERGQRLLGFDTVRSLLVSCERGSFTWAAAREYLVGGLGPGEGAAAVVPAVDEGLDRGDEVLDRGEAAAPDGLPGDDQKKTSTMFSHDPDVGVKCRVIRGCLASQARTSGWVWAP